MVHQVHKLMSVLQPTHLLMTRAFNHSLQANSLICAGYALNTDSPTEISGFGTPQVTYGSTGSVSVQDAIGQCVLGVARIVPDGMLVFFSSYSLLDRLMQRWQVHFPLPTFPRRCCACYRCKLLHAPVQCQEGCRGSIDCH